MRTRIGAFKAMIYNIRVKNPSDLPLKLLEAYLYNSKRNKRTLGMLRGKGRDKFINKINKELTEEAKALRGVIKILKEKEE